MIGFWWVFLLGMILFHIYLTFTYIRTVYRCSGEHTKKSYRHSTVCDYILINPYPAKLIDLNFHSLEVVSRYHDPQLHVCENYSYFFNLRTNIWKFPVQPHISFPITVICSTNKTDKKWQLSWLAGGVETMNFSLLNAGLFFVIYFI